MNKVDWYNLWKGDRVEMKTWKPVDGKPVDIVLIGTVIRLNSNRSQALVKWDNSDSEIWYGRLGIELINHFKNMAT